MTSNSWSTTDCTRTVSLCKCLSLPKPCIHSASPAREVQTSSSSTHIAVFMGRSPSAAGGCRRGDRNQSRHNESDHRHCRGGYAAFFSRSPFHCPRVARQRTPLGNDDDPTRCVGSGFDRHG